MALIALAADKGAPGVTTAAVALGAVWPRPVLVAECDQAGGDLVYRLPAAAPETGDGPRDLAAGGGMLNPSRGLLSLAATARRGLRPDQIAEHCQRLVGGLDVLVGTTNAEQAQAMSWLWGPLGRAFAGLDPVDVLADCGRLGAGTPLTELMHEADLVVLLTRATLEQVAHLRERVTALTEELRGGPPIGVLVLADPRDFRGSIAEVDRVLAGARGRGRPADPGERQGAAPPDVTVLGGLALDPKGAELLSGRWGGRLDRSLLIRSAREVAGDLAGRLAAARPAGPVAEPPPAPQSHPVPPPPPPPPMTPPPTTPPATSPSATSPPMVVPPPAPPGAGLSADGQVPASERPPGQVPAGGRHEEGRR